MKRDARSGLAIVLGLFLPWEGTRAEEPAETTPERFLQDVRDACFQLDSGRLASLCDAERQVEALEVAGAFEGQAIAPEERAALVGVAWALFAVRHPALTSWIDVERLRYTSEGGADGGRLEAIVRVRHKKEKALNLSPFPEETRCALLRLELHRSGGADAYRLVELEDLGAAVRWSDVLRLSLDRRGDDGAEKARERMLKAMRAAVLGDADDLKELRAFLDVEGDTSTEDGRLGRRLDEWWTGIRRLYVAWALVTEMDDAAGALRQLDRAPSKAAESFLGLKLRAKALVKLHRNEQALDVARRGQAAYGDDGELGGCIGDALFCLDRREEAIEAYRRALEAAPGSTELISGLGLSLPEGDKAELAAHFEDSDCYGLKSVKLCRSFLDQDDPDAAEVMLENVRNLGIETEVMDAEIHEKREDYGEAARLLEKVLARDSSADNRSELLERWARDRLLAGDDAIRIWEELSEEDAFAVLDTLAHGLERASELDPLEHLLALARVRRPGDAGVDWWQADVHWLRDEPGPVVEILSARREEFAASRDISVVERRLVRGLLKLGRVDEARIEAQRSTARDGDPWFELLVETKAHRVKEAASALERCVEGKFHEIESLLADEEIGPTLRSDVLPLILPARVAARQAELDADVARYRELLPAELTEVVPLAEAKNAYFVWAGLPRKVRENPLEALSSEAEAGEDGASAGDSNDDREEDPRHAAVDEVLTGDADFPEGDLGRTLEAWIEELQPYQSILDAGIERGGYQTPPETPESGPFHPRVPYGTITALASARLLRAKQLAALGRGESACDEVVGTVAVARLYVESSKYTDAMMGAALAASAAQHAVWLSGRIRSSEIQRRLIEALSRLRWASPQASLLYGCLSVFAVADRMDIDPASDSFGTGPGDEALRTVEGKNAIAEMLSGHPRPFDRLETLRLVGEVFRRMAATEWFALRETSAYLDILELEEIVRIVPQGLLGFHLAVGDAPNKIWPASVPRIGDLSAARAALTQIENPLGRCVAAGAAAFWGTGLAAGARNARQQSARREIALAVIGIRLHRLIHGSPPASLQTLVDVGILQRLPSDPSSGKPLLYRSRDLEVSLPGGDETLQRDAAKSAAWPDEQR